MPKEPMLLPAEEFQKIKKRAEQIKTNQSKVKEMFKDLADMYWISETDTGIGNANRTPRYNKSAYGADDVRITATTSSRDRVTGLHRMLRTTRPQFEVKCKNTAYANRIEKFLDRVLDASNARGRATIESELTLSGILFADENLNVTSVDDLLAEDVKPIIKRRLEELRKRTPILLTVGRALESYPVWGEYGKSEHLEIKRVKGRQLVEQFDISKTEVQDDQDYDLWDYWNLENRCCWWTTAGALKGKQIKGGAHGLPDIPRFSSITDGTDLFFEEERKRSPFLYGMWKSGLHKREDELLTALFTSVMARGVGPLVIIDKSDPNYSPKEIDVDHKGLVRYFASHGKPQLADDKAFDNNLISLSQSVEAWGERTTIPSQTLGENIQPGTPYSGYAMASQNGRIPIIPIQEATEKVFKDAADYILLAIKEGVIETTEDDGLTAKDILDDVEVTVRLEVDLPQDALRNAQTLAQLKQSGVPLSNEWMHTTLQIKDSDKMTFDVMAEAAAQAAFQQDLPSLVQQMLAIVSAPQTPLTQPPEGPGETGELPPGYHRMPDGSVMADSEMQNGEYPAVPGGPAAAQAGGEVLPATEPQSPEANRGVAR